MSKTLKRLMLASIISCAGFTATITWYKMTSENSKSYGTKKIARLVYTQSEVQRKPVKKLIWQPALVNEDLYVGEAIRTTAGAEARIEFIGTKTAIDLEPDSAIILEEADGQTSLNFLKGNILVKAVGGDGNDGAAGSGITLKSGDKTVALGTSEVSLGKGAGEELDMQVLKGKVAVGGKVVDQNALDASKIKILKPTLGVPMYLNTKENELAEFAWSPLPAGYQVFLEVGEFRDSSLPVPNAVATGESGVMKTTYKIGKSFFRLVAKPTAASQLPEIFSSVNRLQVLAKIPPQPLSPETDAAVAVNKIDSNVTFLWSNPAGFTQIIFEIATSADLKTNAKSESLKNVTEYTYKMEKPGTYFWRVSGVLDGVKREVISSKVQKFSLKIQESLIPPELERPELAAKISEDNAKKKGVILSWKPALGAESYKLLVEKVPAAGSKREPASVEIKDPEGKFLQKVLKDLTAGNYQWTVASVNSKGEASKFAEKRTFSIQSLPIIEWADGKVKDDYYYLSLKPTMQMKWERGDAKATKWRLSIAPEDQSREPIEEMLTTNGAEIKLPKDGIYEAEVEGIDDRGQVVAKSVKRRVRVSPAPLLPAPEFASTLPEELESNNSGNVRVSWNAVTGATEYILYVKSPDGAAVKEVNSKDLEMALRGLMPGKYQVTLRSVDQNGRPGAEGEAKTLKVPDLSNVRAPKLKGVKVK